MPRSRLASVALALLVACGAAPPDGGPAGAGWNIRYEPPAGLREVSSAPHARLFRAGEDPAYLAVVLALVATRAEVEGAVAGFLAQSQVAATRVDARDVTLDGRRAATLEYRGSSAAGPAVLRAIAVFGEGGTAVVVLALATEARIGELSRAAEAVARSVEIGAPEVNAEWVSALAGTFRAEAGTYAPSSGTSVGSGSGSSFQEWITFDGQGAYSYGSGGYVWAESHDSTVRGDASTVRSGGEERGRYTVIGQDLVLSGPRGTVVTRIEVYSNGVKAGGKVWTRG